MSLQSDLIQHLVALNTSASGRVYHEQIPQKEALPVMATTELNGNRPTTLSGAGLLARSTIRLAIFARTAIEMDSIATIIRDRLREFRGWMGDTKISSIRVETSADEVALSDGDNVIKGKGLDLFFVYY